MDTEVVHCHYGELTIRHFDIVVPVIMVGRAAYFPLRTLCEKMGIAPQRQIDKVRAYEQEDSRWSGALRDLPLHTIKGERPAACLNRRHLGRWFDSIDPKKCAITARGPLEQLQAEIEAATDRFLFGETTVPPSAIVPSGHTIFVSQQCQHCGEHTAAPLDQVEWFTAQDK